jgi:hypothetical protein
MAPGVQLTRARYIEISNHLARTRERGELDNVISELTELDDANDGAVKESLDALIEQKKNMSEAEIRSDLRYILGLLDQKLRAAGAGRRRRTRKTRRGTRKINLKAKRV